MFADSLLESHFTRSRRGWTTLTSFALQSLAVAAALMAPLLYTEAIPKLRLVWAAPIGPPPGPPPPMQRRSGMRQTQSNVSHGEVIAPPTIPNAIVPVVDEASPRDAVPSAACVPGGTGTIASANPVFESIGNAIVPMPAPPPKPVARPPRISHMMEGNLIYRVQPIYPPLARAARIQGAVHLRAIISRNGTIANLQAIDGHPMLIGAAIDAVRQWRYRPYILNDEPVEVETQVTVNFSLSGG
jgi:periplasmic protein TonB